MSLLSGWPVVSRTQLILPLKTVSAGAVPGSTVVPSSPPHLQQQDQVPNRAGRRELRLVPPRHGFSNLTFLAPVLLGGTESLPTVCDDLVMLRHTHQL
jgi:hypothetical protein